VRPVVPRRQPRRPSRRQRPWLRTSRRSFQRRAARHVRGPKLSPVLAPHPTLSPAIQIRNPASGPSAACGAPQPAPARRPRHEDSGPATPDRSQSVMTRPPQDWPSRDGSPPPTPSEGMSQESTWEEGQTSLEGLSVGSLSVPTDVASLGATLESARKTAEMVLVREGLAEAPSQVAKRRPCPLLLGTPTPPTPTLPLLSSLGSSILDPLQEKLPEVALKSRFLHDPARGLGMAPARF
jgi:hypothetical protein